MPKLTSHSPVTAGIALIDDNGASVAGTSTNISLSSAHQAAVEADASADAVKVTTAAANASTAADTLLAAEAVHAALAAPTAAQDTTLATATTAYATANAALSAADQIESNNDLAAGRAVVASQAAVTAAAAAMAAGPAAANATARATRDGMFFESYYDFNVTASAESDNGISVSVGFDMGAGNKIDYNDDDKLEAQGVDVGDADVAVSYAGWTLAVDQMVSTTCLTIPKQAT